MNLEISPTNWEILTNFVQVLVNRLESKMNKKIYFIFSMTDFDLFWQRIRNDLSYRSHRIELLQNFRQKKFFFLPEWMCFFVMSTIDYLFDSLISLFNRSMWLFLSKQKSKIVCWDRRKINTNKICLSHTHPPTYSKAEKKVMWWFDELWCKSFNYYYYYSLRSKKK